MKQAIYKWSVCLLILIIGFLAGILLQSKRIGKNLNQDESTKPVQVSDSTISSWNKDIYVIEIRSTADTGIQKAYFYKTRSGQPRPLIVSLHTWSGDYTQTDELSELCRLQDLNYIHPDFRGRNSTRDACCSKLVINDIDDAISYAIKNANVDTSQIYMIGYSGGGYATLAMFMKSRHSVRKFSAWVPISDLSAWYNESKIRENGYAGDILKCTGSENNVLNEMIAREKSPLYWNTPKFKIQGTELMIYAGVYDGIQGSVPITQSINFYNKILKDLSVNEKNKFVSFEEKSKLLEFCSPLGEFGVISNRKVCLQKSYKGIKLTIFTGNHEILPEYALNELLGK